MSDFYARQLEALRARSLDRQLREVSSPQGAIVDLDGKRLINFSSNDYLGLANDPRLREAATKAIAEFGVGAGASRLISGTQSPHLRLENALAQWKGTEAALCFSSGYAAALGTIPALAGKNDVILLDKLCHASLIDAVRLSGATVRVFPHNHLAKLKSLLEWSGRNNPAARVLIITESVFSMDGDRAPLREIVHLKKNFGAQLFLDEAHAVGVIGPNGQGLAAEENLSQEIDVQMGTLSKALGVAGGYICGSRVMIEWLINRARSFIFSTAPPPALAAAANAAIDFLSSTEGAERRRQLWRNIDILAQELSICPVSAIVPWIIGDEAAVLVAAKTLHDEGLFVPAIRYPTVAKGSARLRITVSAAHEKAQLRSLVGALKKLPKRS
ncbi:MAG TPA: 8-amino-7-oxononanoate synthase [Chthoniobacterales bacterium]|nr:8-amino-7-oxononanoate synthase [Chthoniobacterales bacterium]